MSRRHYIKTVTIASGSALSGALEDLHGLRLLAIRMPGSWTAANLTFQASISDTDTYADVHDNTGTEVTVTADASQTIICTTDVADDLTGFWGLKVRSGTSGTAVNQAADREIDLVFCHA